MGNYLKIIFITMLNLGQGPGQQAWLKEKQLLLVSAPQKSQLASKIFEIMKVIKSPDSF